jgi:hypothetical protein
VTIQEALGVYLSGYPGLVALIADGLFAVRATQDRATPFVVYRFENRVDINTLGSVSPYVAPGVLGQAKLQISAFHENYDTVNQVAEQLRQALSGFQGLMGGGAGVNVQHCLLEDMRDEDIAEPGYHEVSSSYDLLFAIAPTAPLPS